MRALLAVAGVLLGGGLVHADTTFEAQTAGATPLGRIDDAVWALTATCANANEIQARQCRQLRDAKVASLRAQPLVLEAEPGTFVVGELDLAKKSAPTSLTGCIRCKPITVDGAAWTIFAAPPGPAPKKGAAAVVATSAPVLHERAEQFPDAAGLARWKAATGTPRVELVVKLGAASLNAASKTIVFDLVGYRVIAPCTGEILAASAPSQRVAADKKACAAK